MWDSHAGERFSRLYNLIQQVCFLCYHFWNINFLTITGHLSGGCTLTETDSFQSKQVLHFCRILQPCCSDSEDLDTGPQDSARGTSKLVETKIAFTIKSTIRVLISSSVTWKTSKNAKPRSPHQSIFFTVRRLHWRTRSYGEDESDSTEALIPGFSNSISKLEAEDLVCHRFINDLDADEESDAGQGMLQYNRKGKDDERRRRRR